MADSEDVEQKVENFLDRAAYYDGRVGALVDATKAVTDAVAAFEALGPMPSPTSPPGEILMYQVRVATACGTVFNDLGVRLETLTQAAKDERETLLKDRAVLGGEQLH